MSTTTAIEVTLLLQGTAIIILAISFIIQSRKVIQAMSNTSTSLSNLQAADAAEATAIQTLQTNLTAASDRVAATVAELVALQGQGTPIDPKQLDAITADLTAHSAALKSVSDALGNLDPASVAPPTLAATTTTLTLNPGTPTAGADLQLMVVVDENPTGAVPTGVVSFLDSGTQIGTATLDNTGAATLDIPALAAGAHAFSASYPGDSANAASTSSTISVTV